MFLTARSINELRGEACPETTSGDTLPSSSSARLGAAGGCGGERIVGPGMAGIAALHFGFDRGVAATPEARQVARDLHRPVRRRQELDHQRYPSAGNGGVAVEAEQLLHADRELGPLLRFVVDR